MRTIHSKIIARETAVSWVVKMPTFLPGPVTGWPAKGARVPKSNRARGPRTALLIALLCAGLTVALLACHGDRPDSFYPTLRQADREGATNGGWIPHGRARK